MTSLETPSNFSNKLKILHVISHFELGGAEKCTFELSHLFNSRVDMGIAAVLGDDSSDVGKNLTNTAREDGVSIFNGVSLPWKFGGFLTTAFQLRRTIKRFQPDIIHLNTELPEFAYVLCILISPSLKHIPVVRTIHNTLLWSRWERLGAWCERKLGDTSVIYVSEAVRKCFLTWRQGCNLQPVTSDLTIYNPITVPLYREQLVDTHAQHKEIQHIRCNIQGA